MSKTKISQYDTDPSNNTDIDGINLAEGMAPGLVNNAIRELMSQLKEFQVGTSGDPVTVGGNLAYSGTLTGSTGVINIGSGQVYKDASGNVGIGTSSPSSRLQTVSAVGQNAGTFTDNTNYTFEIKSGGSGVAYIGGQVGSTLALAANGSERVRIDGNGNVGIGTSSPGVKLDVVGGIRGVTNGGANIIESVSDTQPVFRITRTGDVQADFTGVDGSAVLRTNTNHPLVFSTNGSERARISSDGKFLVGTTSTAAAQVASFVGGAFSQKASSSGSFSDAQLLVESSAGNNCFIAMHIPTQVAPQLRVESGAGTTIDCVDSAAANFGNFRAAAFNVSSDYRIKENITSITNALDRVALIQPKRFSFTEGSMMYRNGMVVDGFIAHEVSDAVPEAVTGEKDAVNANGDPILQSIDQSKLVPLLTAAIQELSAKVDALQAELNKIVK